MRLGITLFLLSSLTSNLIHASDTVLGVTDSQITQLVTYERTDESVLAKIYVNNSSRVGPNPAQPDQTCELWTYDQHVYSSALAAVMSGKKVHIRYKDRGDENGLFCKVYTLAIQSN